MRLAAIYIEDHEYLFDKPQTINFGGRYFYAFTKSKKDIIVTRKKNETYIDNLFDLTKLKSKITNLNAIVGQNGSGKSTVLDIIRRNYIENEYALPQTNSLFLVEEDKVENPTILRNDFSKVFLIIHEENFPEKKHKRIELKVPVHKKSQSIYFSPHYDYRFNPDFDNVDNHDISFDKIVELDLKELNNKSTNESGWSYSPNQELLFKNALRQIEFLGSELVNKRKIFKDLFQLQEHSESIMIIRGYKKQEREWNTPWGFREIMSEIGRKINEEINKWAEVRKFKSGKIINQLEVNKYILKREVLKAIMSLLYEQMEKKNEFLDEGNFPYSELESNIQKSDGLETLLLFVDNCTIKLGKKDHYKVFEGYKIHELIRKIYDTIDKSKSKDSVTNQSFRANKDDAIEILRLQRLFLNEFNNYYHRFYSTDDSPTIAGGEIIEEFVNYMPFAKRLSSGEHALLNLFSRIYNFLNSNLKENKFRELKDHYILLLDEADLSFHPSWKKKYVQALLKTIPYFFDELENHPSIQIIFTTHDPLTLSDLPNSNVVYLERRNYDTKPNILDFDDKNRPNKTFGANISDLLADSFFIENSLIGDFSFDKIQETIVWLNHKDNHQNEIYYKKLIKTIDEPIIQRKLAEMYDDKTNENFQIEVINEQIKKLEELKRQIQE